MEILIPKATENHFLDEKFCSDADEGSYLYASFFFAAGALGSHITIKGLPFSTEQEDAKIVELLGKMDAEILIKEKDNLEVKAPKKLHHINIDIKDSPNLIYALLAPLAVANGMSIIKNVPDSEVLRNMIKELQKMHISAEIQNSILFIEGGYDFLPEYELNSYGNPMIYMFCYLMKMATKSKIKIIESYKKNEFPMKEIWRTL
jgi:3-phosphoshikimate 1-carboxyvinyltransferase